MAQIQGRKVQPEKITDPEVAPEESGKVRLNGVRRRGGGREVSCGFEMTFFRIPGF